MPRYFFHVDDGNHLPDHEGVELTDVGAAGTEAIRAAGSMLRDGAGTLQRSSAWNMSVTDAADQLLFTLRFSVDVPSGAITFQPA
jgi:hypothetical protein